MMEIPKLKGNPFQKDDFSDVSANSFERTFNLEKAKLIRISMWLLVLANAINCLIIGTWIVQLITATSQFAVIDDELSVLGLLLPAKFTLNSIVLIAIAISIGTVGHFLWLRAGSLVSDRTKIGWSLGLWFGSILLPVAYIYIIVPSLVLASTEAASIAAGTAIPIFLLSGILWLASLHFMAQELKELSSVVRRYTWLEPALIEIGALLAGVTNFAFPMLGIVGLLGMLFLALGISSTALACARGCSSLIHQRQQI